MTTIHETLKERGKRYGEFTEHAYISQALKEIMLDNKAYKPYQSEAIEMICHKLARIKNGDADYDDSWRDIAGYAQLVVDELNREIPAH